MDNQNKAHVQTQEKTFNTRYVTESSTTSPNNYFGNNSFSGADMVAIMHITGIDGVKGTYTLGSLQTLSYSTSMQRMPIRSIGNVNAKDYVMGQRTIAGSLVFAVFDKHFAYEAMKAIKGITEEDYHFLADELPPFDITITFANEYGKMAKLAIYGVRLVNEGQVMSINDIYTENTYQYVALDIDYLSDQTTNTSGAIYSPLKANESSTSAAVKIEDIIVDEPEKDNDNDKNDIAKHQLVYVKTTDAYTNDGIQVKGKIQLDLFKRVEYGTIHVESTDGTVEKSYELTPGVLFPIVDSSIPPGDYVAKYYSGESFSKATNFTINLKSSGLKVPEPPVIVLEQKLPDDTYTVGLKAVDDYTIGIQYTTNDKDESSWKIIDPPSTYSVIKGLKEYTTYYFRSYNKDNASAAITCYTDGRKEHLFSDFKSYIVANKNYLSKEYPYINKMWDLIWTEWVDEPTGSISVSVQKIKGKLDLLDENTKNAYELLCDIAAKYEKNQSYYISQTTTLTTPKIINDAGRLIEFDKNITSLEIKALTNGFKTIVPSLSFKVVNNKYRYFVNSKYYGMHEIIAKNANGFYAPPLYIYVPLFQFGQELMEKQNNDLAAFKERKSAAELSLVSPLVASNNSDEKENLLQELSNNIGTQKVGISSPIVEYITDSEVKVKCIIPAIYTEECFLCLTPVSEIGKTQLKQRVKITGNNFNHVFYKSKNTLLNNTRYALWIEDEDNKIVSYTTGFDFNSSSTKVQELKNTELIAIAKKAYSYDKTKSFAESYIEEEGLSDTAIYNSVIEDVINTVSNVDFYKFNYLLDAISAKHKSTFSSVVNTDIPNLKFSADTHTITGSFKTMGYTKVVSVYYNGFIFTEKLGAVKDNKTFLINGYKEDNLYMYLYFTNDAMTKVSKILLFDIQNRKTLGMKVEVDW